MGWSTTVPPPPARPLPLHSLVGHALIAGEVTQGYRSHQPPDRNHELAASPLRFGGSRLRRDRAADDPELLDAKRNLGAERIAEEIRRVTEAFHPLRPEQRGRLAALLSAG